MHTESKKGFEEIQKDEFEEGDAETEKNVTKRRNIRSDRSPGEDNIDDTTVGDEIVEKNTGVRNSCPVAGGDGREKGEKP